MKVITFTEARNKLKSVLDRVVNDADYRVITRRDADDAVVMSLDYFNSLLETVVEKRNSTRFESIGGGRTIIGIVS